MTDPAPTPPPRTPLRRALGFALGLTLVGAAIFAVARSGTDLGDAYEKVRHAPVWVLVFLALVPAMSWVATSGALWALTRRFGDVAPAEMGALVGSAWLLNYLPLKPGLVGRLAYHKRVNNIPVKHSVRVLVDSVILTTTSSAFVLALALLLREVAMPLGWQVAIVLAPAAALALACTLRPPGERHGWVLLAALFRYLDVLVWIARYAAVFYALDDPIGLPEAVLVASASQLAIAVPLTGNGLGVREWAVGLTVGATGGGIQLALAADLINRAAELLVAVPIGLLGARWVARRHASRRAAERNRTSPDPATTGSVGSRGDLAETDQNRGPAEP